MSESNVNKVKEAYDAFGRGDVAGIVATLTEDVRWETPGEGVIPYAGTRRGRGEVEAFFAQLAEAENVTKFEPREFIASGDVVIVLGEYGATINATGRDCDCQWVHIFRFRDGLIGDFQEFLDTARIAEAYRPASRSAGE